MKRATRIPTRRTTTTKRLAGAVAAALLAFAGSAAAGPTITFGKEGSLTFNYSFQGWAQDRGYTSSTDSGRQTDFFLRRNRLTFSGRVADPDQRVSAEEALRGVTIAAAYSLQLEKEIGTLEAGKLANMTVLAENPLKVDPVKIRDIAVWGTVVEGRVLPVGAVAKKKAFNSIGTGVSERKFAIEALSHAALVSHPG